MEHERSSEKAEMEKAQFDEEANSMVIDRLKRELEEARADNAKQKALYEAALAKTLASQFRVLWADAVEKTARW